MNGAATFGDQGGWVAFFFLRRTIGLWAAIQPRRSDGKRHDGISDCSWRRIADLLRGNGAGDYAGRVFDGTGFDMLFRSTARRLLDSF
jgi:hypothetical protein